MKIFKLLSLNLPMPAAPFLWFRGHFVLKRFPREALSGNDEPQRIMGQFYCYLATISYCMHTQAVLHTHIVAYSHFQTISI